MSSYWREYKKNNKDRGFCTKQNLQTLMEDWGTTRIDPYLIWADLVGLSYLEDGQGGTDSLPVMIELADDSSSRWKSAYDFAKFVKEKHDKRSWSWIQVPEAYRKPAVGLQDTKFFTAEVTKDFFSQLGDDDTLKGQIERFELGIPVIGRLGVNQLAEELGSPSMVPDSETGGGDDEIPETSVIVAVIDDGLAFLHEKFRLPHDKTRILYFWDQNEPQTKQETVPKQGTVSKPKTVQAFEYGYELDWKAIEKILIKNTASGTLDEVAGYREVGYERVNGSFTHGTHVMDLACGEKPDEKDVDKKPKIICVQIRVPGRRINDTSGRWLGVRILDGLRYILARADAVAEKIARKKPIPVVVNLSFGNLAGPHDGSSMLESAIDELITWRNKYSPDFSVVIAAGNHHLARCHARFSIKGNDEEKIMWRILPDDATPSFMEIWLPDNQSESVYIAIAPPGVDSPRSGWIHPGTCWTWNSSDGDVLCTVVYLPPKRVATGNRGMILVAVAPTASDEPEPQLSIAPAGIWKLQLKNEATDDVDINAWIQRDETPRGFPLLGRQSYFEDPEYERYDSTGRLKEVDNGRSYIKRAGTLNAIATGKYTVVVGGYRDSDGEPAWYSARGEGKTDIRLETEIHSGPDALAVSERSAVRHGVIAAGTRSGSAFVMRGTSVAAPQVARLIAKEIIEKQKNAGKNI